MSHAPSVFTLGEALIDLVDEDGAYRPYPGGSSLNVAVGASRLGVRAEYAGAIARDALGDKIADFLTAESVGLASSPRVAAQTPLAVATLVNSEPQYSFYASPPAYAVISAEDLVAEAVTRAAVVHTGSLALAEENCFNTALHAFTQTQGLCTLDPNVRASMVPDLPLLRERILALAALADVVKLSIEDAEVLWPGEEPAAIAAGLLAQRPQAVFLTRAGDGLEVFLPESSFVLPVPAGRAVVNTTAAGDTVMATITSLLAVNGVPGSEAQWRHIAETALAAAAITCSRQGGAASMPTIDELAGFLGELAAA